MDKHHWILDGKTPVACDLMTWAKWFAKEENGRRVSETNKFQDGGPAFPVCPNILVDAGTETASSYAYQIADNMLQERTKASGT